MNKRKSTYAILSVRTPEKSRSNFDRDTFSALVGQMPGFLGMMESDISVPKAHKVLAIESEFIDLEQRYANAAAMQLWFTTKTKAQNARTALLARFPGVRIGPGKTQVAKDWQKLWRKHYRVQKIFGEKETLWILPAWERVPAAARQHKTKYIWIHPGQAFGAGTHPTTKLCLKIFLDLFAKDGSEKRLRILDFGAGTGILGIAAARAAKTEGRSYSLEMLEVDRAALSCLRRNLKRNGVDADLLRNIPTPTKSQSSAYDLIFANVLAPVLEAHSLELLSALNANGNLILSGILHEDSEAFLRRFFTQQDLADFEWELFRDGDWAALLIRRSSQQRGRRRRSLGGSGIVLAEGRVAKLEKARSRNEQ